MVKLVSAILPGSRRTRKVTSFWRQHQFLNYKENRLTIPSNEEYSVPQLKMMLHEVAVILGRGIPLQEWEKL